MEMRWMIFRIPRYYRNVFFLILLIAFLWSITLLNVSTIMFPKGRNFESDILKKEIVLLSEKYVKALARENADVVDGPYAGRFTAYDLKKTIAVLLENIMERVNKLENSVSWLTNMTSGNGTDSFNLLQLQNQLQRPDKNLLTAEDILKGKAETCELTQLDKQLFPNCNGKVQWMKAMWKSDPCYEWYGVDGSDCSFIMYLSEVEGWCPSKAWMRSGKLAVKDLSPTTYAQLETNIDAIMEMLVDPNERKGYAWIRMRIHRMWNKWVEAIKSLSQKQDLRARPKKKILVHLGLLSKQSGWKFAEMQFKGGPLGELVQWSDLLSTLYMLGHDLTITSEYEQLGEILNKLPSANSPCQSRTDLPVDIIYTDIVGLRQFKKHVKSGYGKFSCLLRILDSFGTEPAYNHRAYAKSQKILTSWGGQELVPQQFFTMFPHSPDNSFMGFVVEQHLNDSVVENIKRGNLALVYGKNEYMWKGKSKYLDVINSSLEIHGTMYEGSHGLHAQMPAYVQNHGILNGEDLQKLLRQTKVFIGLGFPYEGPAPLEAIGNGAVFINPKFDPPHNSKNTHFFTGKPNLRGLTSQHPYAEQFIGEPHVYTINVKDLKLVKDTVKRILEKDVFEPYLPYEYTEEGMLQRMNAYIEHQNFCQFQKKPVQWPPKSAITNIYGDPGKSCKEVCWENNLICERSHFMELNSHEALTKYSRMDCQDKKASSDILYPAIHIRSQACIIQKEELLFSCVGANKTVARLCPCRNYVNGQTAMCQGCDV